MKKFKLETGSGYMRNIKIAVCALLIISMWFTILIAQTENIIINNTEAFNGKQRTPVQFPHGKHFEGSLGCKDCHHQYSNGKNILDEGLLVSGNNGMKCAACHNSRTGINLMRAYHTQCIGCHTKNVKAGEKAGPRLCGECHPRNRI